MRARHHPKNSGLQIVEVFPIARGFREERASYFSKIPYPIGSIIFVPMRSKERAALVISSSPLSERKSEVRGADFSLRKIREQSPAFLFSPLLLDAATNAALDHVATPGEVLSALIPSFVFESLTKNTSQKSASRKKPAPHRAPRRIFIQDSEKERYAAYQKEIEKTLKAKLSAVVLVPTVEGGEKLAAALRERFASAVLELSSRFSKKKQQEIWAEGRSRSKPTIFVLTPGFLSFPTQRIGLCILEKSGSHHYVGRARPFLDARVVFEHLSAAHGAALLSGDILIPLRERSGEFPLSLDSLRAVPKMRLVDMTRIEKQKEHFTLLSEELIKSTKAHLEHGDVFWFVARRGLFPETVCRDCGAIHLCPVCGAPFILHNKQRGEKQERIFLCHRCGARESAMVLCKTCGSWRLESFGIGIDRVHEAARKFFDNVRVISHDHTPTKTAVRKALENTEGGARLIIGTDLALFHLKKTFSFVGIVSIDSRLGISNYDAEEAALRTLLSIALFADETCLVQTRLPHHRVFAHARGANLNAFREEEASIRKQFSYPPFGDLIDLSFVANKARAEALAFEISRITKPALEEGEEIAVLPLRQKEGRYRGTIVLKLRKALRKHSALRSALLALPQKIEIRVNQRSV